MKIETELITGKNSRAISTIWGGEVRVWEKPTDVHYSYKFNWYTAPTGNCQMWCISQFNYLLATAMPIKVFKTTWKACMKPLLWIDVREGHLPKIKKIFKGYIKSTRRYKSTNNSDMVTIMILSSEFCSNVKDEEGN